MSNIDLMILAPLALAFLITLLICGIYVLIRVIKTRLINLFFLSFYFFLTATYYILLFISILTIDIYWAVRSAIVIFGIFTNYLFIHETFFKKKVMPFKWIILVFVIFSIFNFSFSLMRDIMDGTDFDLIFGRLGQTTTSVLNVLLIASWQSHVAFKAYKNYKQEPGLAPHVKKRYLFFGLSAIILISISAVDCIGTFGAMYLNLDYDYVYLLILLLVLAFSIMHYFTWIMPGWFKRILDRGFSLPGNDTLPSEEEIMKALQERQEKL
jgi:hypothetical protein